MIFHNIFPSMRSPTNIVLLSMAVCDLLTIALPAPWWLSLFSCQSISFLVRYFSKWSLLTCDILVALRAPSWLSPYNIFGLLQCAVNDIITSVLPAPRWLAPFCQKRTFFSLGLGRQVISTEGALRRPLLTYADHPIHSIPIHFLFSIAQKGKRWL